MKRFALQFQAFEANITTLRRITDAEAQNILVANEDGRGLKGLIKISLT